MSGMFTRRSAYHWTLARSLVLLGGFSGVASGHPPPQPQPEHPIDERAEDFIHRPAGFERAGSPAVAGDDASTLSVVIRDAATQQPAFCRVNVVGADGNYYEPEDSPLAAWSLQRLGNRLGKGPVRYLGWCFYTSGEFRVRVPHGDVRIEVWKGIEYRPLVHTLRTQTNSLLDVGLTIRRTVPMSEYGYYSGDTHIHLDRTSEADDDRALDLIAAEDLRLGFILCMNDPRTYSGLTARQMWPQDCGFGRASIVRRGRYAISSGQEYRCHTYGHICLLLHDHLVLEGSTVDPNNWPVFGAVAAEARQLGGFSIHAHGGYEKEIYADFAQRTTDGVELMQFARYRGVSLEGWYQMLNAGYAFPAVGASDYPYCRLLGDCRTYVHLDEDLSFRRWGERCVEGRSFFTTGPLLLLDVDGHQPGEHIVVAGAAQQNLTVQVRVRCEVTPVTHLELIVNGKAVRRKLIPRESQQGAWFEAEESITLDESSWIAARAFSLSPTGHTDAEAHTNPVYVDFDGRAAYVADAVPWLLARLEQRIDVHRQRDFPEQLQVLEYFRQSRDTLLKIQREHGQAAGE